MLDPGVFDYSRSEFLYHGTSAERADVILEDGLLPHPIDGRVYLTNSLEVAKRYAEGAALAEAAWGPPPFYAPTTPLGRHAAECGGRWGAVICVKKPAAWPYKEEKDSGPPPLPWQSVRFWGHAFFREEPLAASMLAGARAAQITELDSLDQESAKLEMARRCLACPRENPNQDRGSPQAGPLGEALPEPTDLLLASHYRHHAHPLHGWPHALGVAAAGARILEAGCEADPAVLLAFAILHDSQRRHEGHNPEHGSRARAIAYELAGKSHWLSRNQLLLLGAALAEHDRGLTTDDPTIGACWDADRLTLPRVGICPNPALLSTAAARALVSDLRRIPEPSACDWGWVKSRYGQLAQPESAVRDFIRERSKVTTALALGEDLHVPGV